MAAPSPLLLIALSGVAVAGYYAAPGEVRDMRDRFTNEYRNDARELEWTVKSLPREVQFAGDEILSLWHRGSTAVAVELTHLHDEMKSETK